MTRQEIVDGIIKDLKITTDQIDKISKVFTKLDDIHLCIFIMRSVKTIEESINVVKYYRDGKYGNNEEYDFYLKSNMLNV